MKRGTPASLAAAVFVSIPLTFVLRAGAQQDAAEAPAVASTASATPGHTGAPTAALPLAPARTAAPRNGPPAAPKCDASAINGAGFGCEAESVVCLGTDGRPLASDTLPALVPGDEVVVKLIGQQSCSARRFSLSIDQRVRTTRLFQRSDQGAQSGEVEVVVLDEQTFTVGNRVEKISIAVWEGTDAKRHVGTSEIRILGGEYFADIGLLVAFAPKGEREVVEGAGNDKKRYRVGAAVALTVYPWGRSDVNVVAPLSSLGWMGFQAGVGANLADLDDEFYLGAVIEPVNGISAGGGVAILEFENGRNNDKEIFADRALFGYFGVTVSTEVFDTARSAGRGISETF